MQTVCRGDPKKDQRWTTALVFLFGEEANGEWRLKQTAIRSKA
jgi:subtilisin-like proprotein convertase family protein